MTPGEISVLIGASVAGGAMNALAGGGTIVTFPTLVLLGEPAIIANATSTVALLPGAAASLFGYWDAVSTHRQWLKTMLLPSLVGGALGSVLLLRTPEKIFAGLAPLLVLFATVLFMLQGALARRSAGRRTAATVAAEDGLVDPARHLSWKRWSVVAGFMFAVAVYGGYFGAGIGILTLAALGFLGLSDIFAMNGIKNFLGFCINGVAAAYFVLRGAVVWPVALLMMAGAIAGGYGGALFALRIGKEKSRAAVVVIGLLVTGILFWQRYHR